MAPSTHAPSILAGLSSPLAFAWLLACGPQPATTTDGSTSEGTTSGSTTGAPVTTGGEPGTTATSSTTSPTTADDPTSDAVSTGAGFIVSPDGGTCTHGVRQARCYQCDIWSQDCPDGRKCSPYDSDQDGTWDAHKCAPLFPDPAHPGEPCIVEGSPFSGIDDCDLDSMCFLVDPDTLTGTCVRTCDGSPEAPECPAGDACHVSHDGDLSLCLPKCDPLLADCPMGQVCIPTSYHDFACTQDFSGAGGQVFDPCSDEAGCDPGLACVAVDLAAECDPQQSVGCCLPFCDPGQPPACPGAGQQCLPFDHDGPGGVDPVPGGPGLCVLPP